MNVILNVVKNLLRDNILSTLSLVGFEEIATSGDALLAMTEYSISLAMTGGDCHEPNGSRNDGVLHHPRNDGVWHQTRSLFFFLSFS